MESVINVHYNCFHVGYQKEAYNHEKNSCDGNLIGLTLRQDSSRLVHFPDLRLYLH